MNWFWRTSDSVRSDWLTFAVGDVGAQRLAVGLSAGDAGKCWSLIGCAGDFIAGFIELIDLIEHGGHVGIPVGAIECWLERLGELLLLLVRLLLQLLPWRLPGHLLILSSNGHGWRRPGNPGHLDVHVSLDLDVVVLDAAHHVAVGVVLARAEALGALEHVALQGGLLGVGGPVLGAMLGVDVHGVGLLGHVLGRRRHW